MNIIPPDATPEEALQLKVEMEKMVKMLPERKRRTFLRYMKKGKESETAEKEDGDDKGKRILLPRQKKIIFDIFM